MTCIVGLVHRGDVYIGGDSAGVTGLDIRTRTDPKVFVAGGFIYGFTSSFRMGQLLRHTFTPPAPPLHESHRSISDYMCGPWIEAVRETFKDHGYASVENNTQKGGNFIVGYRGRLFEVHSDFQVAEYADGYTACGCGESYALGAIAALREAVDDPARLIGRALEVAAYFSAGVRAPFTIERLCTGTQDQFHRDLLARG